MQVKGTINAIFPQENVSGTFSKRVFWLNTDLDSKYPQVIHLEFTQEKCAELDKFTAGEPVEVEFNLRGRQWKDKVFNTLQAWKITSLGAAPLQLAPVDEINGAEKDDLPF